MSQKSNLPRSVAQRGLDPDLIEVNILAQYNCGSICPHTSITPYRFWSDGARLLGELPCLNRRKARNNLLFGWRLDVDLWQFHLDVEFRLPVCESGKLEVHMLANHADHVPSWV